MSWSEITDFVIEGNPRTIRHIRHLLRRGTTNTGIVDGELPYNDFVFRTGAVSPDEYKQVEAELEDNLQSRDVGLWLNRHGSLLARGGYVTIRDVVYHPSKEPRVLRFTLDAHKYCFASSCFDFLTKQFPDVEVYFDIFDELWFLNDCEQARLITNDISGKYFPLYMVWYDFRQRKVWNPLKKAYEKYRQNISLQKKGFQSEQQARDFANTLHGHFEIREMRELCN